MNENALAYLRRNIVDRDDVVIFKDGLKVVSQEIFQTGLDINSLSNRVEKRVLDFINLLQSEAGFPATASERSEFFATTAKELDKIEEIKITFAFRPSREFLQRVQDHLGRTTSSFLILDVFCEEEIVGGCVIEYKGKFADYSTAKEIDQMQTDPSFVKGVFSQ